MSVGAINLDRVLPSETRRRPNSEPFPSAPIVLTAPADAAANNAITGSTTLANGAPAQISKPHTLDELRKVPLAELSIDDLITLARSAGLPLRRFTPAQMSAIGATEAQYADGLREFIGNQQNQIYSRQARNFMERQMGLPSNVAFSINDTASAMIGNMLEKQGIYPPNNEHNRTIPNEPADFSFYNQAGAKLASITTNMGPVSSTKDVDKRLSQMARGVRRPDISLAMFEGATAADAGMAQGISSRLNRTLVQPDYTS